MMSRARTGRTGRTGLTAVAGALTLFTALSGCASGAGSASGSGGAGSQPMSASVAAESNPNLDLGTSLNGAQAPDFRLTNQFGQPMSLSQFRGKVVILAFSDSECTTVCPLTTQAMVLAKELLGRAGDSVRLLGVDANPQATAVSDVMAYSQAHGMVNRWDFLTGPLRLPRRCRPWPPRRARGRSPPSTRPRTPPPRLRR